MKCPDLRHLSRGFIRTVWSVYSVLYSLFLHGNKTWYSAVKYGAAFFAVSMLVSCGTIPYEAKIRQDNTAIEYMSIADEYYNQKKYAKAVDFYKKAQSSALCYTVATYKMACSYALSNQWGKSRVLYEELLQQDPENRTLRESIGYVAVMSGNLDEGSAIYKNLSAEFPEDGNLLKNYILTLIASGHEDEAQEELVVYKKLFGEDDATNYIEKKLAGDVDLQEAQEASSDDFTDSETQSVEKSSQPAENGQKETASSHIDAGLPVSVDDEFSIPDWTEFDD